MLQSWLVNYALKRLLLTGTAVALAWTLYSFLAGTRERSARLLASKTWSVVKHRTKAWAFLLNGRKMMHDAYKQAQGAPFYMDVPENRYWVISSRDQIKEMNAAPQSVLSLLGAAKDLLQPKYTMKGFNWTEDKQGTEGATLIKTLRNDLTSYLPELLPEIRQSMSALLDQHFESLPWNDAQNTEFIKAGISMVEHTLIVSDLIRILPKAVANPAGKLLASCFNSSNVVYDALEPLVTQRFEERDRAKMGHEVPERKDCVQWIMNNSPKTKPWTVQRVVHELVALWYGSVHITSVSACLALLDLCNHEEYIQPLRAEIETTGWEAFDKSGGRLLPLMDSFIKESSRLNPVECNGTKVEVGQWICSPLAGMNLDPISYARPDEFHGFRFVEPQVLDKSLAGIPPHDFQIPEGQKPSQFTDTSDVPFWGAGKMTCGGRFYASSAIKTLLGLFLMKWDMRLEESSAKQHFAWRSWIYPYASTKGILQPINKERGL